MTTSAPTRRAFLASTAMAGATLPFAARAETTPDATDDFRFEVVLTDDEWRERLTPVEFDILRGGATEEPKTSPNWDEMRAGVYHCKGCELPVYSAPWKVVLDKGWAFFAHAEPNSVLTGIDYHPDYAQTPRHFLTMIEAHCRRCGSHLGHILYVEDRLLHCINGTALDFRPTEA